MITRRKRRLIDDLPTSKCHGVFIGFVELDGTAQSTTPLRSNLAAVDCVAFEWSCEEKWSRTVHYTDSKGRSQTRHESGWKQVAGGGAWIPFPLRDDTGEVLIRPDGAKIEMAEVFSETVRPGDPLYYSKGPAYAVPDSDHIRRFVERAIPIGRRLYVAGQSREREDVVAAEIAQDPAAPLFLITVRAEKAVSSGLGLQAIAWDLVSLVAALGGVFWSLKETHGRVDPAPPLVIAGAAWLFAWMIVWAITAYNSLVNLRQRVKQAWSLVEVQLKRRNDLIPNLVEAVRGFRDYERTLQTELAEARAQQQATAPGKPGPDPHALTPSVRAVVERYPELKAQESFLSFQEELSETEQRIALARAYFNDIATFHNTRLEIVPDRWIARLAGMKQQNLMTSDEFERVVPQVSFGAEVPGPRSSVPSPSPVPGPQSAP